MFNRVCLIGNLGADPEIKYAPSGTCIANIRLAVNDKRKDATGQLVSETYWFTCVAFGKTAEVVANYTSKGSKVGVDGKLIQRTWEDQSGNKRSSIEIRVDALELISNQNGQGNGQGNQNPNQGQRQPNQQSRPPAQQRNQGYQEPPPPPAYDSDIPF